ncbi:hypothetical protein [Magnetovibrio sp.]|uniref:hypothetical protein n=1 Tax=Magnetovibrio sp. TaxID=2024836 RepID=UPI002F950DDB
MNRINKTALKQHSLERVYGLAQEAQVPLAIVRWHKHMSQHEDCICESKMFDRKLCGFCLLSRLQADGLRQSKRPDWQAFERAAQSISGFLMTRDTDATKYAAE